MGKAGFEPTKAKPTDLQSVLVDRLSISPTFQYLKERFASANSRADGGIRTPDMLITNQLLWPTELHRQTPYFHTISTKKKADLV